MQHTMQELIATAKEAGYSPTPRMVQDWIELGLLDRPERHGRGYRRGISATWSEHQLGLFCSLLEHRRRVNRVAVLCNIPVWTWLYFGDDYVPLRQVRRALDTWGGWTTNVSWAAAKRSAHQLLDVTTHPQARQADKRDFFHAVVPMCFRPNRRFNEEALLPLLQRVIDPKGSGLSWTLGGMEVTPQAVADLVKARLRAVVALADKRVDDSLFHWARYSDIVARADYQWRLAHITTGDTTTGMATVPTLGDMAPRACVDLVTLLGLGLDNPGDAASQSLDSPIVWKARNLRSIVHGEPAAGGVKVTVEVKPQETPEHHTTE
jgi:hypothetical protein